MEEKDVYRDTPVRYTNEVGESFRPLIHVNWVRLSYIVACTYVLSDTISKTLLVNKLSFESDVVRRKKMLIAFSDTILWQSFASVIIPGCTINRLCASSLYILKKTTKLPKNTRKWITTGIGLASIPFIIKPIDRLVDYSMNNSFRKVVSS
uniref:Mitochondrial fission process protein 1 n=1 Tax=Timema cristinae TaxID=61476 RepID=A0A7R9CXL1_TIMCR|nr:unnamed protein product [Timema cristinae]